MNQDQFNEQAEGYIQIIAQSVDEAMNQKGEALTAGLLCSILDERHKSAGVSMMPGTHFVALSMVTKKVAAQAHDGLCNQPTPSEHANLVAGQLSPEEIAAMESGARWILEFTTEYKEISP
jgi:hypothetical protein